MNIFKVRSQSFTVSECDPTYKVKYLGNVLTTFVKGEGCVDRPVTILWNNYLANPSTPKDMQVTVTNSGLKAVTKEQGLMEYRCHRIAYCYHHPQFPKLFIWVYRHEGRKMKVEVRCHAVLCKSEAKAKAIYTQLRERLAFALSEFMREKTRRQNSRLVLQRTHSVPCGTVGVSLPLRTQLLRLGQHFKPPASLSTAAPSLGAISEETSEPDLLGTGPIRLPRQPQSLPEGNWPATTELLDDIAEEDDGSVFLFAPPDPVDCRLTEMIPSFFVNGEEGPTSGLLNGFSSLNKPLDAINTITNNEIHPPGRLYIPENDLTVKDQFYPEVDVSDSTPSLVSPECDDQSIESGFSEQDAHEL